jgi:mannose-1-phosphate guanylyltransferase
LQGLTAVILVGGPGTRLQPLTDDRPKSVLPVLNKPFMEHIIAYLRQYGIEDIILTLSYLPDVIREYLGDGSRYGVRLRYCLEQEPRGTAGAVKNAEAYLDNTFFVLNGDVFTDMNLGDMLAFHRENKAKATISLTWVDDPSAFGVVETDGEKRVQRFIEKPPLAEATTNWINAGTYILEPEVLEHIPPGVHYMFEKGLYPKLLDTGVPVYGYPCRGYWLDMGTPEKYFSLNVDLLSSKIKSPLVSIPGQNGIYYSRDAVVHPSAELTMPVVIGSGSRVGQGVHIKGPVVIGSGCHVEDGASIENAVLWNNVSIHAGARLRHCVISSDVTINHNQDVVNYIVTPSQTVTLFRT